MYTLKYLPSAANDIFDIEESLYRFSPLAADKFIDALDEKVLDLTKQPLIYRIYEKRPYFRCMPLPYKYLCFYHVDEDTKQIKIHRILHGKRNIPDILSNDENDIK